MLREEIIADIESRQVVLDAWLAYIDWQGEKLENPDFFLLDDSKAAGIDQAITIGVDFAGGETVVLQATLRQSNDGATLETLIEVVEGLAIAVVNTGVVQYR